LWSTADQLFGLMAKRMKSCHRAVKLATKRKPVMCQFDSIPEVVNTGFGLS
jgi:hypothetical protein